MNSFTSSPIAGTAYFMPKSVRLIVATRSPPHMSFLLIGLAPQLKLVAVSVTGLVTPSRVSVPSTDWTLSPEKFSLVDLNTISGNSATLKKSVVRRCSSRERCPSARFASPVEMVVVGILTSIDPLFAARSITTLPVARSK